MIELTGRFPPENIRMRLVPRPPSGLIEALLALSGPVSTISDVMDQEGLQGAVPATQLRPLSTGQAIAGPALTVRKIRLDPNHTPKIRRSDIEVHNLTTPGDVLVIEGHDDVSNMGGLSAATSRRQGSVGAIIWGGCRDVAEIRKLGHPVWSTAITPVTGVGRVQSEIINGDVLIAHVTTRCGDIVVADDDGVCVIPVEQSEDILIRAQKANAFNLSKSKLIHSKATFRQIVAGY